jgi:ABC-type transport system involved in cytochrome bd biosynthesis fused ATPase/permease subunit
MADRKIAKEGMHGQLMERNGLYARMVHAQARDMPPTFFLDKRTAVD